MNISIQNKYKDMEIDSLQWLNTTACRTIH